MCSTVSMHFIRESEVGICMSRPFKITQRRHNFCIRTTWRRKSQKYCLCTFSSLGSVHESKNCEGSTQPPILGHSSHSYTMWLSQASPISSGIPIRPSIWPKFIHMTNQMMKQPRSYIVSNIGTSHSSNLVWHCVIKQNYGVKTSKMFLQYR